MAAKAVAAQAVAVGTKADEASAWAAILASGDFGQFGQAALTGRL